MDARYGSVVCEQFIAVGEIFVHHFSMRDFGGNEGENY
jgi:hypothetical protein